MFFKSNSKLLEFSLLVLLSFLWGGSFTLVEVALESTNPITIVIARLIIGAGFLVSLALVKGLKFPNTLDQWKYLILQGFLQSALPFYLLSWGQKHIDSGLAGLLNTTPPLFVALIGYFFYKEKLASNQQLFGVSLGFLGVLVMIGPSVWSFNKESIAGQLAITAASISYALAAINARKFAKQDPIITGACAMVSAAFLACIFLVAVSDVDIVRPNVEGLLAIILLGFFSTGVAMIIYFRLVRTLGPVSVTSGGYLRAGFSLLLGYTLLSENITPSMSIGLIFIFLGVAITGNQINLSRWLKRKTDAQTKDE
jgi:drug/metabolite transporter (DMT)-like permease